MPEPPSLPPSRPSAVVTCAFCSWRARHTADDFKQVGDFLRARLLAHVRELHPDQAAGHNLFVLEERP
jgi:hypothetical protein